MADNAERRARLHNGAMPRITWNGRVIECAEGTRLKDALAAHGGSVHNGPSKLLNCHGLGSCGTCAVEVRGQVSAPGLRERLRTLVPPLRGTRLRLACQVRVLGDVEVVKHGGLWGQRVEPR